MKRYVAMKGIFHWGVWDRSERVWVKQNIPEVKARRLALELNSR